MLHYLASAFFIYIVFLLLLPQQVAAVTLLVAAWLTSLDIWQTVPWYP